MIYTKVSVEGTLPQKSVTGCVFFTIVRMAFLLCGKNSTATFLTPEEGDIGFTQKSNKHLQKYKFL